MREPIVYDCPYCLEHYLVWDDTKGEITDEKYKQFQALVEKQLEVGRCKNCKRQHPDIPTTLEMDGLFDEKDIKNRFFVMIPCNDCGKFTKQDTRTARVPCTTCGSHNFDVQSSHWASIRTWNPLKKISKSKKSTGA